MGRVSLFAQHRWLSTRPSPKHSIYLSTSTNPYFNLTFEDWLFRHKPPDDPLLLIYRDDPCVVIGRHQNPWSEVNFTALREAAVPLVRRRSGGGAVYHDLGNTNFSIHVPRSSFDRRATAHIVLRAVRSLGIENAHVNDRNDICVGKDKMRSAYKIVHRRAYHHGTMLISTRLGDLGNLLRPNNPGIMVTKGIASVRSPVCNLRQFRPTLTHDIFADAVIREFRKEYGINEAVQKVEENGATTGMEYIRNGMAELSSWEWAYGQTPEFTYTISQSFSWGDVTAEIRSKHGIILSCAFEQQRRDPAAATSFKADSDGLAAAVVGKRYGFFDDDPVGRGSTRSTETNDVFRWLKSIMASW